MSDTTFRSAAEPQTSQPEVLTHTKEARHTGDDIAVPHTDYARFHQKPFMADYFGLGDSWNDPVGGYPKEISLMESFIQEKIDNGEYPNTTEAVKNRLKALEKLTGLEKDERLPIKIETLVAYMKFIKEKGNISRNASIYGTH
jgi:hypothetical protein